MKSKVIRLSKSCLGENEKTAVLKVLDQEYLGMGKEVNQFEKILSEYFGRTALCVSNGTSALQLALQAINIGKGDEVLVQSITYVASFQAISATGAIPVPCDVEEEFLSIDLKDAEKKISPRTKAIMPVHYAGCPGKLSEVYKFASKYKLRIVEDAAHAFGSKYKGKLVGSFGDISCFSFDGIKNITSGEGGCVVTNDKNVIESVSDARLLGVEKDTEKRFQGKRSWDFDVTRQGWRYHMSNIMASIGIQQFINFNKIAKKRKELQGLYISLLYKTRSIIKMLPKREGVVPHIFVIILDKSIDRDLLREDLLKKGIETGIHYVPNHLHTFFKNKIDLKTTSRIKDSLLSLPLHPDLTKQDIEYVVENLLSELE